jgi:transcriptional regulator PpsR
LTKGREPVYQPLPDKQLRPFKAPRKSPGGLDANTVAHLVTAVADLSLILDREGVIRDVAVEDEELLSFGCESWIGRAWADVVSADSRPKVAEMLQGTASDAPPHWRQINHPGAQGKDLLIRYSAIRLGEEGRIMAVGRDMRQVSLIQQRLLGTQAQLERDYSRLRESETRYQTLFQLSTEAIIVLDAGTMKITEANPAGTRLMANGSTQLVGRSLLDLLDPKSMSDAQTLLGEARATPRAKDIVVRLAGNGLHVSLSASLFRHDKGAYFLVRLGSPGVNGFVSADQLGVTSPLLEVISALPDGFVIIGETRKILMANAAFLELAQLAGADQARGERIDRWLGRVEVDLDVLVANLREYGSAKRFPTVLRGEFGAREEVEVSGAAVLGGDPPCYGLTIRRTPAPTGQVSAYAPAAPRSFEQLKELVGRVPMRELVRETTDIIEQMCIEAALELTGDNRASAAEMLGLSRQSLYVKLRRHGLGELDEPGAV